MAQFAATTQNDTFKDKMQKSSPVIRDNDGSEVYRDDAMYSTRHGVLFTWLTTEPNQLWILSSDVGTFYIAPDDRGTWIKHYATDVPREIKDLRGH